MGGPTVNDILTAIHSRRTRQSESNMRYRVICQNDVCGEEPAVHKFETFREALHFVTNFNNHPDRLTDGMTAYGPTSI